VRRRRSDVLLGTVLIYGADPMQTACVSSCFQTPKPCCCRWFGGV